MSINFENLPGPKGLPIIGNLHQVTISEMNKNFENWASEYGEVYKVILGPTKFTIVSKPEIIHQLLKARPSKFRRLSKMDNILREQGVNGVFNAEGEDWKMHRKIVTKGLDLKHQQQFFPSMVTTVEKLYKKMVIASKLNQNYDIQDDLTRFTVDITTSLAFGFEMNTLEKKGGVIQEHMEKIFPMIFKRINEPIPFYKFYKTKKDKEYDIAMNAIEKQVDEFIENTREKLKKNPELNEKPSNFLESILVASVEEKMFTNLEIKGNLLTLMLAGEDTTAHSLSWIIYFLCQNPDVQTKIQQEVDTILTTDNYLKEYSNHSDFIYIEAVINESLRLKSVAPLLLLEPLEDIEIENYLFKKETKIVALTHFASLTEDYFSDSETFNPDRWLEKKEIPSKCPMHNEDAFMPFGFGPRFCPGKNLAILEMKVVLSMILKNFTIEMVTPISQIKEIMAFALMPSKFEVRLIKRK